MAAQERPDIIDEHWRQWRAQVLHTALMPTAEEYGGFWQRFMQASPHYPLPPWFGGDVVGRVAKFVQTERRAFFDHLQQQREFIECLASLPLEFPDNELDRLLE